MPSLFSRKTKRGQPGRTERLIGAFVLGLLALVVAAFLLTSGLLASLVNRSPALRAAKGLFGISEKPLFVADPANLKPPPASRDMRTAEDMLPVLPAPWKRTELEIIDISKLARGISSQGLAANFREACFKAAIPQFDAVAAWRGVYQDRDRKIVILIADAGTPEAAFGMFGWLGGTVSHTKGDIQRFSLGRGGRLSREEHAAAFWAGRYYTEVLGWFPFDAIPKPAPDGPPDTQPDSSSSAAAPRVERMVEQAARAAAALQISYGGPFWAEAVLPSEGRVEDSLRFVHRSGLGLDELTDLWTASYPGGVTLGVMQPKSPEGVLAALRTRFEKTAASQPAADTRPSPDLRAVLGQDLVAGQHNGRMMVAFPAGPYVFVATGEQSEPILAVAKSTRERVASGTGEPATAASGGKAGKPRGSGSARFAEVEGGDVQAPAKVERFTDNLYEKIDGREGQYRAFGFVELRFGQYQDTRRQQAYDVYLYDMGQPNNALGVYMAEKPEGADPLPVGQEGYLSGANAYFYKGKYYVNVLGPADGDKAATEIARRIAAAIAATIAESGGKLWADDLLPKEGRIGSLRYQPTSALAHDFLDRFFFGKYDLAGTSFEVFIHKAPGASEAAATFKKYAEETPKYETVVAREKSDGGETLVSETMGSFTAAFHKGPYFAGVTDCKSRDLAVKQAAALRQKLGANDPGEPAPPKPAEPGEEPSSEGGGENGH